MFSSTVDITQNNGVPMLSVEGLVKILFVLHILFVVFTKNEKH